MIWVSSNLINFTWGCEVGFLRLCNLACFVILSAIIVIELEFGCRHVFYCFFLRQPYIISIAIAEFVEYKYFID